MLILTISILSKSREFSHIPRTLKLNAHLEVSIFSCTDDTPQMKYSLALNEFTRGRGF